MTANTTTAAGYVVHVEATICSYDRTEEAAAQSYGEAMGRAVRCEYGTWEIDINDDGETWKEFSVTECTPRFYAALKSGAEIREWGEDAGLIDILEVEEDEDEYDL